MADTGENGFKSGVIISIGRYFFVIKSDGGYMTTVLKAACLSEMGTHIMKAAGKEKRGACR